MLRACHVTTVPFESAMYSSRTGQWLSEDPIEFDALDENLKRYVHNLPTTLNDPDGLSATGPTLIIAVPVIGAEYIWDQPGDGPTPRSDASPVYISYPIYPANLYGGGPGTMPPPITRHPPTASRRPTRRPTPGIETHLATPENVRDRLVPAPRMFGD